MPSSNRLSKLTIPEEEYPVLKRILNLSEEELEEVSTAIRATPPRATPSAFSRDVARKLRMDTDTAMDTVDTIFMLYRIKEDTGTSVDDFLDVMRRSIEATDVAELQPIDGDWAHFNNNLRQLLSLDDPLRLELKAVDLWTAYDNTYHDVTILTDVRPLFGDNPDQAPVGALIMHTLVLEYHSRTARNGRDAVQVVIDHEAISDLRKALNRAESKARSLQQVLTSAEIPLLQEKIS